MAAVLRRYWPPLLLAAATAAAMIYTYVSTHQIFPDTQYYIGWTYRLLGYDRAESSQIVHSYVAENGVFPPYADIWSWFAGTKLTQPRMLLPVLSIPFVWAFGPGGIVVVPGIAFFAAVMLTWRFVAPEAGPIPTLLASVIPLLSPLALVWSVGGLTDSLALLLHVGLLLLLPWKGGIRWPVVLGIIAVVALTGPARFIAPYTAPTVGLLWLWAMWRRPGHRWAWTIAAAAAAVGELVAMLWTRVNSAPLTPTQQLYLALGGRRRPGQTIRGWYREHLLGMLREEWRYIFEEPALFLLVVLAIAGCIVCWRSAAVFLVLAAAVGSVGIMIANPAVTHFRYEMPILPALIYASALFLQWVWEQVRPKESEVPVAPDTGVGAEDTAVVAGA